MAFGQEALEAARPGVQGPVRLSALVPREPTFSEPVSIVAHGSYPSLAGAPTKSGPVEAAMAWYDEASKRLELSLLTLNGIEPHLASLGSGRNLAERSRRGYADPSESIGLRIKPRRGGGGTRDGG